MKKREIEKAIEAGTPLLYDRDAHRSYGRRGNSARLVRVVRAVEEGEKFSREEAERLGTVDRTFFREVFATRGASWRSEAPDNWYAKKAGWIVEEIAPEGDLEPLSELLREDTKPGRSFFSESRYLVAGAEARLPSAIRKREATLAKEENLERYAEVVDMAEGTLGWLNLRVGSDRVTLFLNGASCSADGIDLARIFAAAHPATKCSGSASLPIGGLDVSAVREALSDLRGDSKFGDVSQLSAAQVYASWGFEVKATIVDDFDAISALVEAARKEATR